MFLAGFRTDLESAGGAKLSIFRDLALRLGRVGLLLAAMALWPASGWPQSSASTAPDYSKGPDVLPRFYNLFRSQEVPPPSFELPGSIPGTVVNGKTALSLAQLVSGVIENNLDIAAARYDLYMSGTDILRAKAGQAPRGTTGARVPSGLFGGAIGAGISGVTGGGGGGGTSGLTGSARRVSVSPRGSFDPSLSLTFSMDNTTSPLNSIRVAGVAVTTTRTAAVQARYTQAFLTGTSFSISFNNQRQSTTSRNQLFNPSFTSSFNLSVSQQLLNGFGLAVNRRFETVAETNRGVAREVFRQQVITSVTAAQNAYWDLVAAQQQVLTAQQALAVAEQLEADNRKQVEIGTLAPLDIVSAQSEVASRKRDLIVAQTSQQVTQANLLNMISRVGGAAPNAAPIEATDALPDPQPSDVPPFEEALATALRNRPEIPQAEGGIRNQAVAVEFTKNRLKPTLNIFGVLASSGRESGLSPIWGQVGRFNYPEYAFGFSLSFPVLNRAAQADDLRARLDLEQADTSLQRTRNQIRLEVRNAIIGVQQNAARVAAARKAVELSQQTLDAEQKKLRAGTSTSYNVIRVQRDLFAAEQAAVQAQVNYAQSRVELDRATGVTLEKLHIDLDRTIPDRLVASQTASPTP